MEVRFHENLSWYRPSTYILAENSMNKTMRFKFLADDAIDHLCAYFMDEFHKSLPETLHFVYHSKTYALIRNRKTELYIQSSGYLYEMLRHEYLKSRLPCEVRPDCV